MPAQLADPRLAWLAMREYCAHRAKRRGLFDWLTVLFAGRYSGVWSEDYALERSYGEGSNRDLLREGRNDRLMNYAIAVDACTGRLSPDERRVLRASGRLPDWFTGAVEDEFAGLRRRR